MTEIIQETLSEMQETVENPMLGVTTEEGRAVEKFVKDMISDWAKTLEDEIAATDKRHLAAYNSKCDANDCLMAKLKEQRSVNMRAESLLSNAGETVVGLMNKMSAQSEEIKKLRTLVKELADALEYWLCDYDCETNGKCRCPADMKREECESFKMRPLVARARKETEDGE